MPDTVVALIIATFLAVTLLVWFGLLSWLVAISTYDVCVVLAYYLHVGTMHLSKTADQIFD